MFDQRDGEVRELFVIETTLEEHWQELLSFLLTGGIDHVIYHDDQPQHTLDTRVVNLRAIFDRLPTETSSTLEIHLSPDLYFRTNFWDEEFIELYFFHSGINSNETFNIFLTFICDLSNALNRYTKMTFESPDPGAPPLLSYSPGADWVVVHPEQSGV